MVRADVVTAIILMEGDSISSSDVVDGILFDRSVFDAIGCGAINDDPRKAAIADGTIFD